MVHYEPPKRSLHRRVDQTVTMIHLPDELLLHVIEHLSTTDVLQLRLVCSNLTPAGNTTLQQRLKRLYIHPSDLSLLTAVKICAHPIFSQKIEEVIVLGSSDESAGAKNPDRRTSGTGGIVRPWPCQFPRPRGHLVTVDQIGGTTFAERYQPLLVGIVGLPSLTKVSYATSVRSAGFNETRKATIKAFCRRSDNWSRYNWTNFRVLQELVWQLNVRDLKLNSPVLMSRENGVLQRSKLQNLAHVSLAMFSGSSTSSNPLSGWTSMCSDLLSNASRIESLKISIIGDRPCDGLLFDTYLDIISACRTRSLAHLSLVLRREKCFTSARNHPPSVQHLRENFSDFIAHHAATLQSVYIDNILFQDTSLDNTIVETIQEVVSLLRRNDCEVMWRINQYHHHEYCGRRSGRWKRCQPDMCGRYTRFGQDDEHLWRQDFERLAGSLGVVAEPDNESWDFGTMVVKESEE